MGYLSYRGEGTQVIPTLTLERGLTMSNAVISALVAVATEMIGKANTFATDVAEKTKASSLTGKEIREIRETSDDPRLVAYRQFEEAAKAKMAEEREKADKIARSLSSEASGEVWTDDDHDRAKDTHKELSTSAKSTIKALADMAEVLGEEMPELPALLTFSGAVPKKSGSRPTGISKPRFDGIEVNGQPVRPAASGRPTLSGVSQMILDKSGVRMGAGEILDVFAKEYGTRDPFSLNGVSVTITTTDEDKIMHEFEITLYRAPADQPGE